MTQIFISYSRKDEAFARRLTTSLCLLGAEVWIDLEDIPLGVKWSTAIQDGLNESEVMIIILSPDSMASSNVEDEWQYFLDQKKPVIPVLLRPCSIHFQLNRLQRVHFHERDYDSAFEELHTELQERGFTFEHTPEYARTHPATQPTLPLRHPPPPRRTRLAVGGAVVLIALVAALVLMLMNGQTTLSTANATNTRIAEIVAQLSATATEARVVADVPTATSTPSPTSSLEPTATPTTPPTDTSTPEPTATPTTPPTDTPTSEPTATATPPPTDTPTPEATGTATPTELPVIVTPAPQASLVLLYGENGVALLNRSSRAVSIEGLIFMQIVGRTRISFNSTTWTSTSRTGLLPSGYCAWVGSVPEDEIELPRDCRGRYAWAQVSSTRRFWTSSERGATFEVQQNFETIGICDISAGVCELGAGS
ncbi:MAG: toll/interleukin-1 receptor domain-containing protein [Anaerolineae bacterium]|nr:toll/interleukin-1 receptor domain-containing protein [Anaerolineae bacterium]